MGAGFVDGFEVISIGPGMVDTPMQVANRSQSGQDYAMADFFKLAYEEGRLQNLDMVAEKIFMIFDNKYDQGKYVSVSDYNRSICSGKKAG